LGSDQLIAKPFDPAQFSIDGLGHPSTRSNGKRHYNSLRNHHLNRAFQRAAAMRIQDYDSVCDVTEPADIAAALSKRHGNGINSFWLSYGAELYPAINILVKRDLASVHYLPEDQDAGFVSVAKVLGARANETSIFFIGPTEKIWVVNHQVVPFSDALKVAQEFAISTTLPKCIQWFEL